MLTVATLVTMLTCVGNVLAWDQAQHWGVKEEKNRKAKKKIDQRRELRGSLGRGKGGGASRHAFDDADPTSGN